MRYVIVELSYIFMISIYYVKTLTHSYLVKNRANHSRKNCPEYVLGFSKTRTQFFYEVFKFFVTFRCWKTKGDYFLRIFVSFHVP